MAQSYDTQAARRSPHSLRTQLRRILWACARPLFRFSPPKILHGWRTFLLRIFGAECGAGLQIAPSVTVLFPWNLKLGEDVTLGDRVRIYNPGPLSVGDQATVSQDAELCTASHDLSSPDFRLITEEVSIGPRAWVCSGAFLGPGTKMGEGAVVGARGVAVGQDLPPGSISVGNPAQIVGEREDFCGQPKAQRVP